MHSSVESTKFATLLHQQSNQLGSPSQLARLAFTRAYPVDVDNNNSSAFVPFDLSSALIVVLNGTAVNRISNMSNSNDIELPCCSFHSKFTRRGTPMYDLERNYSLGLERYIIRYLYEQIKRNSFSAVYQTMTRSVISSMLANTSTPFARVLSYYSYMDVGLEWLANSEMATQDGSSVIFRSFR
jgi:hypothetical protein